MNKKIKMHIITDDELTIETDTGKEYVVWFDEKEELRICLAKSKLLFKLIEKVEK